MSCRTIIRLAALVVLLAALPASALAQKNPEWHRTSNIRPNVVFILIDDLGWTDLGFMNSSFYETPNLNRLAQDGIAFTSAYAAAPICSPARASILTGEYPARLHLTDWLPGRGNRPDQKLLQVEDRNFFPLDKETIAEVVGQAGYTTAFMGKWHLGGEGHLPTDQGFEINVGGYEAGSPGRFGGYFSPYRNSYLEDGPPGEYLTTRLGKEAAAFIADHKDRPFFLYLAYYAVHTPLQAPKKLVKKYEAKANSLAVPDSLVFGGIGNQPVRRIQEHPTYAAMVESMDRSVGRVLRAVEESGVAGRTIVIFTSDNGGLSTSEGWPTSNRPLKAGKGWLYEGGIRVPLVIKWPGTVEPGSTSEVPVSSVDFFPTIVDITGIPSRTYGRVDGVSLAPVLRRRGELQREALYWHYPHYSNQGGAPGGAIRRGRWKLIEHYEDGSLELYNLTDDVGETSDLAEKRPKKAAALREQLEKWRRAMDAQMPEPNPNYMDRPRQH